MSPDAESRVRFAAHMDAHKYYKQKYLAIANGLAYGRQAIKLVIVALKFTLSLKFSPIDQIKMLEDVFLIFR